MRYEDAERKIKINYDNFRRFQAVYNLKDVVFLVWTNFYTR